MIIKDERIYLNYTKDIRSKVENLCTKIPLATPQSLKQDIEKIRVTIFAKIGLIEIKALPEFGLIPNSDWVRYQKEIDELLKELSGKIGNAICYSKRHE
ncbi:MAG: hypothetical protein J5606_03840 [Bacteroidales bacterium]|nr:hypothetical protein [Bacteroidales bacterium]